MTDRKHGFTREDDSRIATDLRSWADALERGDARLEYVGGAIIGEDLEPNKDGKWFGLFVAMSVDPAVLEDEGDDV